MAIRTITYLDKNAGIVDDEWDDASMQKETKKLIGLLKSSRYVEVQTIKIPVLIELSKYFNTEFGVTAKGSLIALVKGHPPDSKKGTAGSFKPKEAPADSRVLLHVHPAFGSYAWHFTMDLKAAGDDLEAVVDWNANIIVYNNDGIKNRKASNGRYEGLEVGDQNWPSFINTNKIISAP